MTTEMQMNEMKDMRQVWKELRDYFESRGETLDAAYYEGAVRGIEHAMARVTVN